MNNNVHITDIRAREVIDSRGVPTIEVEVYTNCGKNGISIAPSGKSIGQNEAKELRDGGKRYYGMGVKKAIENTHNQLKPLLLGQRVDDQWNIDNIILSACNHDKSNIGANAVVATSLAILKAAANAMSLPLYRYIAMISGYGFNPDITPMVNIINGGEHSDNNIDIQETMIVPLGIKSFSEKIQCSCEIYHSIKNNFKSKKISTNLGDEGGFAPNFQDYEDVLKLVHNAIIESNYQDKVFIAIDAAASSFFSNESNQYKLQSKIITKEEFISFYDTIISKYPVISIEDPFDQNDHSNWQQFNKNYGNKIMVVGDDLFTTQYKYLNDLRNNANSIIIKINQVGTFLEMMEVIKLAKKIDYKLIVSHRSGETEDVAVAHIAAGIGADFIKFGSMARGERVAKYNEMTRIFDDYNK